MENVRKNIGFVDIGDDARRQYIDARATFLAWEAARKAARQVSGGMYWKSQHKGEYLIRTQKDNSQKSLGRRSPETERIFSEFVERKAKVESRERDLKAQLVRHQRMNRALFVGRTPQLLIDILNALQESSVSEHFMVVGTHALYAYEAAAGVRFGSNDALATQDVDLLWDTRKLVMFSNRMKILGTSMLGLLQKVDPSFRLSDHAKYTSVNSKGFEVDIIRREVRGLDPHPLRMTDDDEDFRAIQARRSESLLTGPRMSAIVAAPSGAMARMETVAPLAFARFKRWMAQQLDRDALKKSRDVLQADLVERLVAEYLPQESA